MAGPRQWARALDLGCGTGLMAKALAGQFSTMDGVDLAARMLDIAQETGLYNRLDCAEAGAWLAGEAVAIRRSNDRGGCVLLHRKSCADLPRGAPRNHADGLFAFTVQDAGEGPSRVGADLRVHHAEADILRWASEADSTPAIWRASAPGATGRTGARRALCALARWLICREKSPTGSRRRAGAFARISLR